jgi:SAM-dependent methyltransferase
MSQHCDPRWSARLYDKLGMAYTEWETTQGGCQEVAFLAELIDFQQGCRVLDVGCGAGRHAVELAARGCTVTGVDVSYRMLELGLELARARDVLVNYVHDDARDLAYAGSYDAALCLAEGAFGILESDQENAKVLERLHTALKPRGTLAVNVFNRLFLEARPEEYPGHDPQTGWTEREDNMKMESGRTELVRYRERAFHADELAKLVGELGFQVEAVYGAAPGDFGRHPVDASRPELLLLAHRSG